MAQAYIAVNERQDFSGKVASEIGALDARAGHFFTPYEICLPMAEISLVDAATQINEKGFLTLNEPTAGAMVLAAADVLERQGFDPKIHLIVKAQDISQLCFHMCFLQLTFRAVPALVERANTLSLRAFRILCQGLKIDYGIESSCKVYG